MKKRKQQHRHVQSNKTPDYEKKEALSLKDQLGSDVLKKFAEKKQEWKAAEEAEQQKILEQKKKEAKEREKNKTFEELLSESNMDWKSYK